MAKGAEIIDYKNRILKDLLHNEDESLSIDLVTALDPEFLGAEDDLIYERVFPYLHIPETQTEARSYVTFKVEMPKVSTKNYFFKDMMITINVIVHEGVMQMPARYSATRADYIASIINKIFNGNKNYGTVPLEYVSDIEDVMLNKLHIRSLRFRCNELNSVRC